MKIKIVKCSVQRYWHKDHIGEEFNTTEDTIHEVKEDAQKANQCYVVMYNNNEHIVVCDDCVKVDL